jgi:hypothetical protein
MINPSEGSRQDQRSISQVSVFLYNLVFNNNDNPNVMQLQEEGSGELGKVVNRCRWISCKILGKVLSIQSSCRIDSLWLKFKNLASRHSMHKAKIENTTSSSERRKDSQYDQEAIIEYFRVYQECMSDDQFIALKNDSQVSRVLIEMAMQSNLEVKTEALQLLYHIHSQSNQVREQMLHTLIIESNLCTAKFEDTTANCRLLRLLAESCPSWYFIASSQEFRCCSVILSEIENLIHQKKVIINTIEIGKTMHQQEELSMINKYIIKNLEGSMNSSYQSSLVYLDVFASLEKILKVDLQELQKTGDKRNLTSNHREFIQKIYSLQAIATYNNEECKNYFSQGVLSIFLRHLALDSLNGSVYNFLIELSTKNSMFEDLKNARPFIDALMETLHKLSKTDERKTMILECLRLLTKGSGGYKESIQNYISGLFFAPNSSKSQIDFSENSEIVSKVKSLLVIEGSTYDVLDKRIIILNNELRYMISYLYFVIGLSKGGNNHTQTIVQVLFPLKYYGLNKGH